MANTDIVKKLKDEGNAHFAKNEFSQAHDKYSAALSKGGDNAILYANRAACFIGRRKYLDAVTDATKATTLDSTYSKGWGRLASAHAESGQYVSAANAFSKALDCLPKDNLTPSDLRQKKQYEDGLSECKSKQNNPKKANGVEVDTREANSDDNPWRRAEKYLRENINQPGIDKTSAWVIHEAEMSWNEGMKGMEGTPAVNALQEISDAILRDRRIFHSSNLAHWLTMYERQVARETIVCNGWLKDVGPHAVLQEAQLRIQKDGWDTSPSQVPGQVFWGVRKAISTKVHGWIVHAFLMAQLVADVEATECRYSELLEFLNKGRRIWDNVDAKVRGIVFEHSFVMGIRVLHLHTFFEACSKHVIPKYGVPQLREVAECLYQDAVTAYAQSPGPKANGIGFESSFYAYPVGEALAVIAYCELQTANDQKQEEERKRHFRTAAETYLQSTRFFFSDDEYHSYYLVMSLRAHWLGKSSLRETLPIMRSLREVNPTMVRIWQHSGLGRDGHRDRNIKYCLDFLDQVEHKIASGVIGEDAEETPAKHILDDIM